MSSAGQWSLECDCGYEWKPVTAPKSCPQCEDPVVLGRVGRDMLAHLLQESVGNFALRPDCEHSQGFDSKAGKWICKSCGGRVRLEVLGPGVVVKFTRTVEQVGIAGD